MHLIPPLLASLAPSTPALSKRIVGGAPAIPRQFPSLVSIFGATTPTSAPYQFCGGALLNPTTVLTAAHCVQWVSAPPAVFAVRAGSLTWAQGGVNASVEQYFSHPEYAHNNFDIAILKLHTPIPEVENLIAYARLPECEDEDPAPGAVATVAGWGVDGEGGYRRPDLYWTDLHVLEREACARLFAERNSSVTAEEWCAREEGGGKGDCDGDSGGPVWVDGVVQGVVSWSPRCADAKWPSVYARVARTLPFIRSYL